jgi:hypothetical protein
MRPDTKQVAEHLKEFAFQSLARAIRDATFGEVMRPFAHAMAAAQAAHGAEMLIKARIAQEHPLLLFSSYPKSKTTSDRLSVNELFQQGEIVHYAKLSEILWSTTGYRMRQVDRFMHFGALVNGFADLADPELDAAAETLKFIFEVVEPIAYDFWDDSFVWYVQDWDDVIIDEGYLRERLEKLNIQIHPKTRILLEETS